MNDAVSIGFGNDIHVFSAVRLYFYPDHVVRVFPLLTGKRGQ